MVKRGIEDTVTKRRRLEEQEKLRRSFLPVQVRILLGNRLYQGDSGVYRAIREAFQAVEPARGDADFFLHFQNEGCYLADLCAEPVDRMDAEERRAACRMGGDGFASEIAAVRPLMIVTVV